MLKPRQRCMPSAVLLKRHPKSTAGRYRFAIMLSGLDVEPPSTVRMWPVTHAPAGEDKYTAAPPMSAAEPRRSIGTACLMMSSGAYVSKPLLILVGTNPGAMALTVIFGASSDDIFLVSAWTADLEMS